MPRSAEQRVAKYGAKIVPDVVKARIEAYKDQMATYAAPEQSTLADTYASVRSILDSYGITSTLTVHYNAIAMELYSLSKRFSGETLNNEAKLVLDKWVARTRQFAKADDPFVNAIVDIASLFGITYTPPTS